jgi:hypothetical protein
MKMHKNEIIAGLLGAIMTLAMVASPALAAYTLEDYPTFLFTDHTANYYIVVGSNAKAEDVVGAVDVATRLAGESYEVVAVPGAAVTQFEGLDKDGINIGTSSGGAALTDGGSVYDNPFPSATLRTSHFSGLKDSTFTWRSNSYDFREQVDVSGVKMRHEYISNINGTEKMEIESGDITYEFVFEKAVDISSATGKGTISDPEYAYPVKIQLLGQDFTIVGVGSSSIKMLVGTSGTVRKEAGTATKTLSYGEYTIEITGAANDIWASFDIKDSTGAVVDSLTVDGEGNSRDSTAAGLTIKLLQARALGTDPATATYEADIVVGPIGAVEKEYDTSADVTTTGTANDGFPGLTCPGIDCWGIQFVPSGSSDGYIANGAKIQVVYKPSQTRYLIAGEKITLPNDYAELGFVGFGTDNFATITIEPVTGITAFNYSKDSQAFGNLNGLKISTDVSSSIKGLGGNTFDEAYVLFNASKSGSYPYPVMIGFYDSAKKKILVGGTFSDVGTTTIATSEYTSVYMNTTGSIQYNFTLTYAGAGERNYYLTIIVSPGNSKLFQMVAFGTSPGSGTVTVDFQNNTVWSSSQAPEFRIGSNAGTAETTDIKATTEGKQYDVGKASQDIVDDSGFIIVSPATYTASDKAVIKVPNKELTVRVYFGKEVTTTAEEQTYNKVVPITTAVAKLDTEIPDPATVDKNLVLIGGSCANSLVQKLVDEGKLDAAYTCEGGTPGEGWKTGEGYIWVIEDAFKEGQTVVVAAGTDAADTRKVCLVLQQYDTLLAGRTETAIKVTEVSAAGIAALE